MKKLKPFLLLILLMSLLLTEAEKIYGQESISITFEEIGQIRGSEEHIIGAPKDIEIINDKVYIADLMDLKIKVFNRDGKFIREMGGRGRGPGEFQQFIAMWVGLDNTLNVIDYLNRKVVTFSESGNMIDEEILENKRITWPREVHPLSPTANLMVYQPIGEGLDLENLELFHVFDDNLENYERSFSLPDNFEQADKVKKVYRNVYT